MFIFISPTGSNIREKGRESFLSKCTSILTHDNISFKSYQPAVQVSRKELDKMGLRKV